MALRVCLHQSRRPFQAARCIFLVQSLRNQWLCRFACTKAAADFRRRGAFSWCKAYAINGFPCLLAPKPPPFSSGAAHFLGAKPTQSMALPLCLHQSRRRFRAAAALAGGVQATAADRRPAATSSAVFPSPWCASGIPFSAFRLLPCASVLRFLASSPRNRRSPGALS